MTNALSENIKNILPDCSCNKNDRTTKSNITDFSKILQTKTLNKDSKSESSYTKNIDKNNKKTVSDSDKSLTSDNLYHINENITNQNDSQNISENNKITQDDIENNEFEAIGYVQIAENLEAISEEIITAEDMLLAEEILTTEDISNKEETTDTTITDEDPTMNNDKSICLRSIEDSTLVLALKSQLHNYSIEKNNISETEETSCNSFSTKISKTEIQTIETDLTQTDEENKITVNINNKEISSTKNSDEKVKESIDKDIIEDLGVEIVDAETGNADTNADSLMQNQTPQEQVVKLMINGLNNDTKSDFVSVTQNSKAVIQANSDKIIEQITKQMENLYNNSKVDIILNPASLGKISLQIINTKEGLSAQFIVSSQDAQNAITKDISTLKENLLAHGINVDSVVVKLQESENNEQKFDLTEQEGSRGGYKQKGTKQQKKDEKQFEQMMFELNENDKV